MTLAPASSRFDSWYRRLIWVAIVETVAIMAVMWVLGMQSNDTIGFFHAFDSLAEGKIHASRTPVYPLIIGTARLIAGETGGKIIVWLLQASIFLFSIGWFRQLSLRLIRNRKVAFLMIAVYALSPGPIAMCFMLLSDSLAMSAMTLTLLLTCKSLDGDMKSALGTALMLPLLVMLRPVFIYLLVAYTILWVSAALLRKVRRPIWITGMASCVACAALIWAYSNEMERNYGYRGLTTVSVTNTYFTVKEAGLIIPSEIDNPRMTQAFKDIEDRRAQTAVTGERFDDFSEVSVIVRSASHKEADEYFKSAIMRHPAKTLKHLIMKRFPEACRSEAIFGGGDSVEFPTGYLSLNIGSTYVIFMVFLIWLAVHDIRRRRVSPFQWFLAAVFIGCNAVVLLGAPSNFSRLMMPDIPVLLLICGIIFTKVVELLQPSSPACAK